VREFPNVATSTSSGGLAATRWHVFAHAIAFVLGFSAIFIIVWGGAATVLGSVLYDLKPILSKAGGVIVIVLGLATLGVVRIPLLYRDTGRNGRGPLSKWGWVLRRCSAFSSRLDGHPASARRWARSSR
jgi:cytochrome c biogenesis protein CcdA